MTRNSGEPLFIAFEENGRRSVTLISTVRSPSIQRSRRLVLKKPVIIMRNVTSHLGKPNHHYDLRLRLFGSTILESGGKYTGRVRTTETLTQHPVWTN